MPHAKLWTEVPRKTLERRLQKLENEAAQLREQLQPAHKVTAGRAVSHHFLKRLLPTPRR